ncbi:MAG: hypothetical protein ABIQ53_13395 [Terracoccus sp.]
MTRQGTLRFSIGDGPAAVMALVGPAAGSLGGARPKVSVYADGGGPAHREVPHRDDE